MAELTNLRDPWLLAVWPGMGNVAMLAAGHLLQQLRAIGVGEISSQLFFEPQGIEVKDGIATGYRLPHNMLFEWRNPHEGSDLVIFLGGAQPATRGFVLCQTLVEWAAQRGVKRLCTFASMATQLDVGATPQVHAVATSPAVLKWARDLGIGGMRDGQIMGLNGLLLAAASERAIDGICLLGELPYFAVNVPNPRAAAAVLAQFARLVPFDIDLAPLMMEAEAVEGELKQILEGMRAEDHAAASAEAEEEVQIGGIAATDGETHHETPAELDPRTRRRIDSMFEAAKQDRSKAFGLKQELDHLGLFKRYENRFLDLFRQAG